MANWITRTSITTVVKVLVANVETGETTVKDFELAGTYKDNKSLMKTVHQYVDTDLEKAVVVKEATTVENLYGMLESDFIAYSQKLDPKTRKPLTETKETK
jgi:hypothetical protein